MRRLANLSFGNPVSDQTQCESHVSDLYLKKNHSETAFNHLQPMEQTCYLTRPEEEVRLQSLVPEKDESIAYFDLSFQSVYDGPGIRVVVFLQACHADCVWCHSPHARPPVAPLLFFEQYCTSCRRCEAVCPHHVHQFTGGRHVLVRDNCTQCGKCIEACPNSSTFRTVSALTLPTTKMPVSRLFHQLLPHLNLLKRFGGITLSGGEALLQKKAVIQLLKLCKAAGVHTAIETSGLLPAHRYRNLEGLVDCWLYGMRFTTDYPHNDHSLLIHRSMAEILHYGSRVLYRIPVVPGHTDTDWYLQKCLAFLTHHQENRIFLSPWNIHTCHYYQASDIEEEIIMPTLEEAEASAQRICAFFQSHQIEVADISAD
jgi:pyruvate formate lyase activating enzyme